MIWLNKILPIDCFLFYLLGRLISQLGTFPQLFTCNTPYQVKYVDFKFRAGGYKTLSMLNSTEHEILTAHKN